MPPRGVTAETPSFDWARRHRLVMVTRKFGDGAEVPRLHCVSGLDISRCSRSMADDPFMSMRRGGIGSGMAHILSGDMQRGYWLVRSEQAGPARRPNRLSDQNVAPAFTM